MSQNRAQIKDTILDIASRGLTLAASHEVSNEQYNAWQNYAQFLVQNCSYQYNPTIYINYLKICTSALSLNNNTDKIRLCVNYLLEVAKIL